MKPLFYIIWLSSFLIQPALLNACTIVPSDDEPDWREIATRDSIRYLVKHSEIYLATAIEKEVLYRQIARFTFSVNRVLRGKNRETIQLDGADIDFEKDFYQHSFHEQVADHTDPEFWAFLIDNGADFGDCTNKGYYRLGTQYLLFLNRESLGRSFEPIKTENDLWLTTIEQAANFQNVIEKHESKGK